MGYDAGAITASLTVDTAKADADLAKIERRVKDLEGKRHEVKITAVFDTASIGRAKAMFAALDNSISRDAMQRLRSSPQGSVLGALNALFSPHPVTGAPSPQQAASQGLLGKMFAPQGGGNTPIAGGGNSTSTVRDIVTGQNAPQKVTVTQQGGATSGMSDQASRDLEAAAQEQKAAADDAKSAADDTKDAADKTSSAARDLSGASSGMKGIFDSLGKLFGGGGSGGGGGSAAGSFAKGLGGGVGPGILGLNLKTTGIVAGVGSALAALPALAGVTGVGMGVAMIGGLVAEVAKGNAKLKAQFTTIGTDLKTVLATAAGPVIPAISAVLNQVPGLLKSIEPQLAGVFKVVAPQIQGVFNGLIPIVHGLVSIIQAAAPAFGPFIGAIEKLVGNLLPGIAMVIKATTPVLSQFGGILGTLGSHLGQVFSAAAPAIKASMTVLGALLNVIGGLLPIVVKLGDVFATALAPVITQLAGVIKSLTPALTIIGGVIASLASAILGDLVSAFTAVAQVIIGVSPALKAFATAISTVFTVLENTGVFAILGDALENLAKPLAALISAILDGLTPILPPIIQALSQVSAILVGGLTSALAAVLPPLTQLATVALQALAQVLPVILPVLTSVLGAFTGGAVTLIQGVASGLTSLLKAIPPGVLQGVAIAIGAVVAAVKLWGIAQAALDVALTANPVGIVVTALAAVAAGFYLAWEKSAAFRDAIKDIGSVFTEVGIIWLEVNKQIVNSFLDMVGTVIQGAADAFGWVPGLGGKLKGAAAAFDDFKNHVSNGFDDAINTLKGWQAELDGAQTTADQMASAVVQDLTNTGVATTAAKNAVTDYTTAIQQNGATSAEAQAARAQLIKDLENAGYTAQQARQLVDNLTTAVKDLPSSKTIKITMDGSGLYTITGSAVAKSQGPGGSGNAAGGLATGGMISQGTGPTADDVPIMASKGEYVVKASSVAKYGTGMMDAINAGNFASGGPVGGNLTPGYISGMYDDFQNQMTTAMVTAMRAAIKAASAAATAAASSATGGKTTAGSMSAAAIEALWKSLGGPASAAANMARIAYAESGDNPSIVQKGEPPGLTGWGLYQITPTSGISQNGQFGNLLNASNNTKAAIYLFSSDGYGPWSSDPVGAGLTGHAMGGLIGGFYGGGQLPTWGGWGGAIQGLAGMMSGASGGGTSPLAGTAFVGNYTGVVSPASGGFGITAQQLGLPPPPASSASSTSTASSGASSSTSTSTSSATSTSTSTAKPKPAALNAAQKAAITVLENLMGGLIGKNQLGEANQANALLNWLGVTRYGHQLSEISFLDSQLTKALKGKNKTAATAAEHLLSGYGVHSWNPVTATKGNAPQSAVISKLKSLIKGNISANSVTAAQQANALLTHLGVSSYTSVLSQISHLDSLLAGFRKKKDTKDIAATETLLRGLGVRHFAQGGTVWEPVVGFGQNSGQVYQFAEHGPETVTPGAGMGGGDVVSELRGLRAELRQLTGVAAAIPRGTGEHVGAALGGVAQSASFARRYHT